MFQRNENQKLILLAVMVVVTGMQIVFRVFFKTLTWSEELCRYLLVWSSFVGASCVYHSGGHISVTVVQNLLPEGAAGPRRSWSICCARSFSR